MNLIRNRLQSSRGVGKLTLAVFSLIAAVVIYSAYHIFPFYYYYFELVNQMEAACRVASEYNDKEIRTKLLYHLKKMQIPARPEDLRIQRGAGKINISLPYREVFYVSWKGKDYDLYVFNFHAKAEGKL